MQKILALGLGGFLGSNLRYWISYYINTNARTQPFWGTLAVNLLGCLVIGSLMSYHLHVSEMESNLKLFVITGMLGALTTFSTFSYETVELMRQTRYPAAMANVMLNLILGIGAVMAGFEAVRRLG